MFEALYTDFIFSPDFLFFYSIHLLNCRNASLTRLPSMTRLPSSYLLIFLITSGYAGQSEFCYLNKKGKNHSFKQGGAFVFGQFQWICDGKGNQMKAGEKMLGHATPSVGKLGTFRFREY